MPTDEDPIKVKLFDNTLLPSQAHVIRASNAADRGESLDNKGNVITYTTFSGADMQFYLNDEVVGTISNITVTTDKHGQTHGVITETMFSEPGRLSTFPQDATVKLHFQNEWDGEMTIVIENLSVQHMNFSFGMDDIVLEVHYTYTAQSVRHV